MNADTTENRLRFVMVGGFLGAGKTTTIARLARHYQQQGRRVGIVTNDQAANLVDTQSLRAQGHLVGEVAGACFCCSFDELLGTVAALTEANRPDLVLAEPVGSCTDLVATVIQPLVQLYGVRFDVAPYAVILKPSHGRKILRGESGGFSPKADYIFRKQLEEADLVILNRIDELSAADRRELHDLLAAESPHRPIVHVSAKTGEGFDTLRELLEQRGQFGRRALEIDYDVYAEGEAELGWLNSSLRVTADHEFALDELLLGIVDQLRVSLSAAGAETAHLKTIGLWEGFYGVANLVSAQTPAELSLPSGAMVLEADVVVNARVAVDPEQLRGFVSRAVTDVCQAFGAKIEWRDTRAFRPGRPVPTHRFAPTI